MKNKYYTPSIEEFYVGFEYEYLFGGTSWQTEIGNQDDILLAYSTYEEHPEEYNTHYRVKYLNQQDIEDLGFQYITTESGARPFFTYYSKDTIMLVYSHIENLYIFYKTSFKVENAHHVVKQISGQGKIQFTGKLKNKSELIKLLKQIDVKK